jgi:hypothetical protein
MFIAVLGTANNWVMDCVTATAVMLLAWFLNELMLLLRPIEEVGFYLIRAERPAETFATTRREYHKIHGKWTYV